MKIPIEFDYEGIQYSGTFQNVHGGGTETYHLYDSMNYYLGRLRKANGQWVFDSTPKIDMSELASFFGEHITNSIKGSD
jgi:hypothetical protein